MLRRTLLVAALVVGASSAPSAEGVRPVADAEFRPLLLGCWRNYSNAHLIDAEYDWVETICFEESGRVNVDTVSSGPFSVEASEAEGAYWVAGRRLYLDDERVSTGWIFNQRRINCDAIVRPNQTLSLTNCLGSEPVPQSIYSWQFVSEVAQ